MQTAASHPCAAPQRDIDTIILEARHLLGTDQPPKVPGRNAYPRDPVTIAKVLALREETGLNRERFCARANVSTGTFWFWEQGLTGGGKSWPELATLLIKRKSETVRMGIVEGVVAAKTTQRLHDAAAAGWEIPATSPVTDLVGDAAKRLEALRQSPPRVAPVKVEVVGVAFPTPQVAPKIVDDRPTAEDLLAEVRRISSPRPSLQTIPRSEASPIGPTRHVLATTDVHMPGDVDLALARLDLSEHIPSNRLRGAELIAARDEAYARFQAATDRMPAAEAAADLVSIYRRSHRGLPGFCRGHYDAEMMAKRLEQWTAGRDEEGEQWDRLIGLLEPRGIKPSINGLGKRQAKAGRVVKTAPNATPMLLIRPARGFLDLKGNFHADETEALSSSWNILVQQSADEVLTQAARANVTLRSFLMSNEAQKPTDDLSRALSGRKAHERAVKGDK